MRHAALDPDPEIRHVGELDRVVLARPDRLGEVFADLLLVDVEGGDELDVADVVAAQFDVHQARNFLGRIGVLVVLDALDEGVGAVTDTDDRDADLLVLAGDAVGPAVCSVALTHEIRSPPGARWMAEHTRPPCWLQVLRLAAAALRAGNIAGKLITHMPHP